jgi:hypothetical protein
MNVEIGAEAALFPEKECINKNIIAVQYGTTNFHHSTNHAIPLPPPPVNKQLGRTSMRSMYFSTQVYSLVAGFMEKLLFYAPGYSRKCTLT